MKPFFYKLKKVSAFPRSLLGKELGGFVLLALLGIYFFPLASQSPFPVKQKLQYSLTDLKFKWRGPQNPSGDVVVVAFDDKSIASLGKWKSNRQTVALLMDSLIKLGAKNIALDILFSEPEPESQSRADRLLQATFKKYHSQLTLAWAFDSDGNKTLNLPLFSHEVPTQGFINATKDADGVIRRISYHFTDREGIHPSLALAAISQRLQRPSESLVSTSQSSINFYGPTGTLPTYSALDIILAVEDSSKNTINLKNKTVFVGVTAMGEVDQVATPFESSVPGVEVQATIADRILSNTVPKEPLRLGWVLIMVLSFGLWAFGKRLSNSQLAFMYGGALMLFSGLDGLAFKLNYHFDTLLFYLNVFFLVLSTYAQRYLQDYRQKTFLRSAFSKYLPPDVVSTLVANPDALKLGGEKKEITILFCDIRQFTQISEKLEPAELNQLLNEVFTLLTEVIFQFQGTVDKYIGDAMMAFFGAPLNQPDHALRACQAALEMRNAIHKKTREFKEAYGVDIALGIGINSGLAHVGNMGSRLRFNYTALGDSVNIASRIEALNQQLGTTILTTEQTLTAIQQLGVPPLASRDMGEHVLKGKSTPLKLFELV